MPARWHETPDGRFKVGAPELTALELVERAALVGGIARVREARNASSEVDATFKVRLASDTRSANT